MNVQAMNQFFDFQHMSEELREIEEKTGGVGGGGKGPGTYSEEGDYGYPTSTLKNGNAIAKPARSPSYLETSGMPDNLRPASSPLASLSTIKSASPQIQRGRTFGGFPGDAMAAAAGSSGGGGAYTTSQYGNGPEPTHQVMHSSPLPPRKQVSPAAAAPAPPMYYTQPQQHAPPPPSINGGGYGPEMTDPTGMGGVPAGIDPRTGRSLQYINAGGQPVNVEDPTMYTTGGAALPPNGTPLSLQPSPQIPQRFYFPAQYDSSALLAATVAQQAAGAGVVTGIPASPSHFVTAAGMVPISQLLPYHQVMRALGSPVSSPTGGHVPLEAAAAIPYAMPFLVSAPPHLMTNYRHDDRDDSPSKSKDDDLGFGRRNKDKDKRNGKKRVERDPDVLAALSSNSPSLDEILKASSVHNLAQDQVGCRFLQQKLDEGGPEAATLIFSQAK